MIKLKEMMSDTMPLDKNETTILAKWFKGHIDRDADGNPVTHRVWFKNIFNPFLRKMGWVIVSVTDDDEKEIVKYEIRKYSPKTWGADQN